jgi:hypothetical protein
VRRSLAKWRQWGLGVVWEAEDGPQEAVTAAVVQVVHVHYHLHLAPGQDPAAAIVAAAAESPLRMLQPSGTPLVAVEADPGSACGRLKLRAHPD